MTGRAATLSLVALHLLLITGSATAQVPPYRVDWLGSHFHPYALNDRGQVVGYDDRVHLQGPALLWDSGATTEIPRRPGDSVIVAQDINDAGTLVLGATVSGEATLTPIVQDVAGARTPVPVRGWGLGRKVFAINDTGSVVGEDVTPDLESTRAFVWHAATGVTYFDLGAATVRSVANDVSDAGHVVGMRSEPFNAGGFLWRNGVTTLLPSEGISVNNRGQVLTQYDGVWENGIARPLSPLPYMPVGDYFVQLSSRPAAINDSGQVAGHTEQTYGFSGQEGHWILARATLWDPRGGTTDLNAHMGFTADANRRFPLEWALDVNNNGQVLGWGRLGGWLLTPIPEPGAGALILACAAAAAFGRFRPHRPRRPDPTARRS